jgi:hypothetical protein
MTSVDETIRTRAYEIGERDGFSGDPREYWLQAEQEIRSETNVIYIGLEEAATTDARSVEFDKPFDALRHGFTPPSALARAIRRFARAGNRLVRIVAVEGRGSAREAAG